jgi:glc operon protein GlcG
MNMRIIAFGLAAAGGMALGGSAFAQNVPSQFVVSGKAAEQIQDFTTINLSTAERIAEACEKLAAAEGVAISIMVLDNDGNHVYMDRMDGQGYLNIVTAEMKARTALMGREPSKNRMNRVIQDPTQELQMIQLGFFPNSGGLPVIVNKQLIGVVGVGGSAPRVPVWSDEICAHKAVTEVIGPSSRRSSRIFRLDRTPTQARHPCRGSWRRRLRSRAWRLSSSSTPRRRRTSSTATRFR